MYVPELIQSCQVTPKLFRPCSRCSRQYKRFCAVAEVIFNLLHGYANRLASTCTWGDDRKVIIENTARMAINDPFGIYPYRNGFTTNWVK